MPDKIVPLTPMMKGPIEIIKGPGLIYQKIPAIMADVGAISKDRRNTSQGYAFRGIDDFYNVLHPIMAKHKVFSVPRVLDTHHEERKAKSGATLIYRIYTIEYIFYAEDGSHVDAIVVGEGMDSGDKAGNKAMAVAHKYALIQVFAIPTEGGDDPEDDSHELAGSASKTTSPATEKTTTTYKDDPTAKPIATTEGLGLAELQKDFLEEVDQLPTQEERNRERAWFEKHKVELRTMQAKLDFMRQNDKLRNTGGDG